MEIDKSRMRKDRKRVPSTQSIFLELMYDTDTASYSLKDTDYEFKGVIYPSIKRLYLEMEDPTEYEFANKYFLGWKHWQRMCANANIRKHIDDWREELELKLRARGVKLLIEQAGNKSKTSFAAAKWLVDAGYDIRRKGRPSNKELEKEQNITTRIQEEYSDDLARLKLVQ